MGEGAEFKISNKHIYLILLLFIVLLGAYLRVYHLDYPVVGYHNWKEVHYLSEARNFARDGFLQYGLFIPAWDYPGLNADQNGVHSDTFPTISILAGLAFKITGPSLAAARSIGILFSLGTIILMYFFTKKLFKREDIAILSAVITAVLPLFVFFSHNVQLMNPGVFFMVASAYFYLRWHESDNWKELIATAMFLALAALTKYPFFVIAIPMLFTFPFKRLKKIKAHLKEYAVSALLLLSVPAWLLYSKTFSQTGEYISGGFDLNLGAILSGAWWSAMKAYAADNYTLLGVFFALIGLISFLALYKKTLGNKFLLGYAGGSLLYVVIMSSKLQGHSYHQFPIAPLFVILIAYSFIVIGTNLGSMLNPGSKEQKERNFKLIKYFVILILIGFLLFSPFRYPWDSALDAKNRQFDTHFIGLDVTGDYIKEYSNPNERIIFSSGQSYGVLWHADRKGVSLEGIKSLKDLKYAEDNLNANWIHLYQWGLSILDDPELWSYMQSHYSLKQVGFQQIQGSNQLTSLLFEKGGSFSEEEISTVINTNLVHSQKYPLTNGQSLVFYYVNVD